MKQFILKNKKTVAGIASCLLVGIVTLSFQDSPFVHSMLEKSTPLQDTVPLKKNRNSMTMKEFDRISENLDRDIAKELEKVDLDKISRDVMASLHNVDFDKIMQEVTLSLKDIDTEKILAEVKKELDHIKFDELNDETRLALENAHKEMEKAMDEIKKIDKDAIKKEIENARVEVEKSREEYGKINMGRIMKEAQEGIERAKAELKQVKAMFNEMEKDGLINSKQGFSIQYKDKYLYINGTKQTEQVTDKYRKYFKEDHFEITIDKE